MLAVTNSTSSTSKPAPMSWVEKLFSRMGATFGSRFADMWRNEDATAVKEVWAIELGKLSAEEVKVGVENLTRLTKAPTLPEFVAHCKSCRREQFDNAAPRLADERRAALETVDANLPRMKAAVATVSRSTASASWAYETLIRGTAKDGARLTPETRGHAVDAVISWAGNRAIDDQKDADTRIRWIKVRKECLQDRGMVA
jgi:hypothetical protein